MHIPKARRLFVWVEQLCLVCAMMEWLVCAMCCFCLAPTWVSHVRQCIWVAVLVPIMAITPLRLCGIDRTMLCPFALLVLVPSARRSGTLTLLLQKSFRT